MNVEAYLKRINYGGPLDPTADTLKRLHRAHMTAVPFENLDIHLKRPIVLDDARLYRKIVEGSRGGFCYELNGLFSWLLRSLGFKVQMLSAGVARSDGGFGPDFDHMALLVELEDRWLADVGFGDSFREPLLLDERGEQSQDGVAYRIAEEGEHLLLLQSNEGGAWKPQYRFTLAPREYADYAEMCRYHQTSPDSTFTQRRVCTVATPEGRITLSDTRIISTLRGERQETAIDGPEQFAGLLREQFGIEF